MPSSNHGPSILNPKVYEALRRKGMSKRRAAMISNAQRHKDSGIADLAIPPHGPNALFNQPSIAQRRRKKQKAVCTCKAEQIAPGVTRIRGNLCNVHGRYGRCPGGAAATPRQPAKTPGQRMTERAALREQNVTNTMHALDMPEDAADSMKRLAAGEAVDDDGGLVKMGLAEQAKDGSYRLTAAGRAMMRAAGRGDFGAARDAKSVATDRAATAAERAAATAKPEKPKKGGGGGGGGKKKPSEEEKRAAADQKKAQQRAAAAPKAGLSTDEADWLAGVASGAAPAGSFDGRHLAELGLTQDAGDTTEATDAGRRLLGALERGDVRGALAAIQDGKAKLARDRARVEQRRQRDTAKRIAQRRQKRPRQTTKAQSTFGGQPRADLPDSVFAGPDRSFPIKTAQDVRDAVRSLGRTKHDKAAVRRGIIRRARAIGAVDALPESWKKEKDGALPRRPSRPVLTVPGGADRGDVSIPPSFTVFKDSLGRDRWAAITTTAYQDKDGEWIGTKAIKGVVVAGDAGAPRGPLRFWHVPGLDLGDCDYQATAYDDRFLIESGTFRNPAAARIGAKAAARGYQMSPGFLHTHREPVGGLYEHIALFERSFVPPGRAANPGTSFITKGDRMLTDEKKKEFEALAGDAEGRALLEGLLAQAATTVKDNDAAGAIYKDAPAWAQALAGRMEALEERLKALPVQAAAGEEQAAADDDLAALETETADDGMGMDDEGFADLLVQKLVAALGPMLQPVQQKDDARAQEIAALNARLKELEGGQPRARTSLAAGMWGQLSGVQVTKEQANAITAKTPAGGDMPQNLTPQEQGAWALIYGNDGSMPQG